MDRWDRRDGVQDEIDEYNTVRPRELILSSRGLTEALISRSRTKVQRNASPRMHYYYFVKPHDTPSKALTNPRTTPLIAKVSEAELRWEQRSISSLRSVRRDSLGASPLEFFACRAVCFKWEADRMNLEKCLETLLEYNVRDALVGGLDYDCIFVGMEMCNLDGRRDAGSRTNVVQMAGRETRREGTGRRTAGSHDSPTPRGRCSAMSSSLVVGGIKVSGDRDPKISSARTTLHAAWAIRSRALSEACASSRPNASEVVPEMWRKRKFTFT
ncbi:hypothetical protein WN55_00219 [Dufourea novaeangliae]|uniref:Uncharacterized protein n=1 Tax=Dufourea novaeangliae TaxID=178035 RepID=A0A154PCN7_DUFNO|nr:hypothetical protein WN55_00219 [Dufourea novaeangliae]